MEKIKAIVWVVVLGFIMFAANALLYNIFFAPLDRAMRPLLRSPYTPLVCLGTCTILAIGLTSFMGSLFFHITSKVIVLAAVVYVLYDWISSVIEISSASSLFAMPMPGKSLATLSLMDLLVLSAAAPVAVWLSKLGRRIRRKIRNS